jgi:hypothetical protein
MEEVAGQTKFEKKKSIVLFRLEKDERTDLLTKFYIFLR